MNETRIGRDSMEFRYSLSSRWFGPKRNPEPRGAVKAKAQNALRHLCSYLRIAMLGKGLLRR